MVSMKRLCLLPALVVCLLPVDVPAQTGGPPWPESYVRRTGRVQVPVLLVQFQGSTAPFTPSELQAHLFADTGNSRTLADYYREVSYGNLTLRGDVHGWFPLSENHRYYEYDDECNGTCPEADARIAELIEEAVDGARRSGIDFGRYDSDGPDGRPNSGDDDGFVDVLLVVYSDRGNGCDLGGGRYSSGINPHEQKFWNLRSRFLDTGSARHGSGNILVNGFVIVAGRNCDLSGLNPIGDYSHEIGHALGLPDLVDQDGSSGGIGTWGLMAEGGAGADGYSPDSPVHLSAWAKARLGWLNPRTVTRPDRYTLRPVEEHRDAIRIPLEGATGQSYLLEARSRSGFDNGLPGTGLLIWKINEQAVDEWNALRLAGRDLSSVNDDDHRKAVALVEADGRNDLADQTRLSACGCMASPGCSSRCDLCCGYGSDAGDPFPGSLRVKTFDNTSTPRSFGGVAICDIEEKGDAVEFRLDTNGSCR